MAPRTTPDTIVKPAAPAKTPPAAAAKPTADAKPMEVRDASEVEYGRVREHEEIEGSKRRMPDYLRRYLLRVQGGKSYLPAAYRILWFRDECPDWGIDTFIVEGGQEAGFCTVQAKIYNSEGRMISSGLKTETRQDFPAGWVEKAETGAIARALAVAGYGTQFAPDMDDENRPSDQPIRPGSYASRSPEPVKSAARSEIWEGPEQCPRCHAPAGKPHSKQCTL